MNSPYRLFQRILFVGLILTLIVMVGSVIISHSLSSFPYTFPISLLIVALHDIFAGLARMAEGNRQQRIAWHREPSILLGIALLFGAFLIFVQFGIAIKLSHNAQNIVVIASWIVFGIPCFFFLLRWIFYAIKKRLRITNESE
jgi:hypothetical protein